MESEVLTMDAPKYAKFVGITYPHRIEASLDEWRVLRAAQK